MKESTEGAARVNRELLERLHDEYNRPSFVESDPISIPYGFVRREDMEIAGFLAATIAWGNRKAIVKSAGRMMGFLGNSPYDFVMNASQGDMERLNGFVHRTFNGGDLTDFIRSLRNIYLNHGGLGGFFESCYAQSGDMRTVISQFRRTFLNIEHNSHSDKHISCIDKGSACKRINMFLRWMVRSDDRGVDLGLWRGIPSSALYLPLDVHAAATARQMGLLARTQNDWRAVEEVTSALRSIDPDDPVRFDFSLFGAGINKHQF